MAIYHTASPRASVLGPRAFPAPRSTRSNSPRAGFDSVGVDLRWLRERRARGRMAGTRRVGLVLGSIVIAFVLAFFSLAQTVRLSAVGYDIDRLLIDQDRLVGQQEELLSDLNRLGRESAIRKQAIDYGLSQLVEPLVVPAN
jgi:hypothetical protein